MTFADKIINLCTSKYCVIAVFTNQNDYKEAQQVAKDNKLNIKFMGKAFMQDSIQALMGNTKNVYAVRRVRAFTPRDIKEKTIIINFV